MNAALVLKRKLSIEHESSYLLCFARVLLFSSQGRNTSCPVHICIRMLRVNCDAAAEFTVRYKELGMETCTRYIRSLACKDEDADRDGESTDDLSNCNDRYLHG